MPLTPEEAAKIAREQEEKIERWFQELSREEAFAWLDAEIEDGDAKISTVEKSWKTCER
jgi:hypothetical protein